VLCSGAAFIKKKKKKGKKRGKLAKTSHPERSDSSNLA